MNSVVKKFSELSNTELYDLMQLRSRVFVVEQNCVYLDADGKDSQAFHLLVYETELLAYARLFPPGSVYSESSIGRVATAPTHRGKGLGRELMYSAMHWLHRNYPQNDILISAQRYLLEFYRSLGFIEEGAPYLEDDIPHVQMRKPKELSLRAGIKLAP